MVDIDVIVPTLRSEELTRLLINSFEKFKPENISVNYVIVENSNEDYHRESILQLCDNITWLQNPAAGSFMDKKYGGSIANALGLEIGLAHARSDYVFLCHNDTCVLSQDFFDSMLEKIDEGFVLIGTAQRPAHAISLHISGLMVKREFALSVDLRPKISNGWQVLDVGDNLTVECRERGLPYYCFPNTAYDEELYDDIVESYPELPSVASCINHNKVPIFAHLSRGTEKSHGMYKNSKKILIDEWIESMTKVFGIKK